MVRVLSEVPINKGRQNLVNLFKTREIKLSTLSERFWTIVGSGSIGAKAEELMRKTWAIERAGFEINPRVVLAMGFFDGFRERCGLNAALAKDTSPDELQRLVIKEGFRQVELKAIANIAKRFSGIPIAVRSSAHGDCRGTGIYESKIITNNKTDQQNTVELIKAIKYVLKSEFSRDAVSYRKNTGLQAGMAIIIEPVVGQHILTELNYYLGDNPECNLFGPIFGGLAYTSTSSGKGFVQIASGLPTQVVKGGGVRIEEGDNRPLNNALFDAVRHFEYSDARAALTENHKMPREWRSGEWIHLDGGYVSIFGLIDETFHYADMRMDGFFAKLKRLESLLGRSQYIEWAMVERDSQLVPFVLQISEVEMKKDFYEFPETGQAVIKSNFVVGTGTRICDSIVFVFNPDDVGLLEQYNETNMDYLVMYAGRLTSDTLMVFGGFLEYHSLSNASVVVEKFEMGHPSHPVAHFEGAIESSGKLFFVARDIDWDVLKKVEQKQEDGNATLLVYPVKVRVTASEKQQKAIVEIIE